MLAQLFGDYGIVSILEWICLGSSCVFVVNAIPLSKVCLTYFTRLISVIYVFCTTIVPKRIKNSTQNTHVPKKGLDWIGLFDDWIGLDC